MISKKFVAKSILILAVITFVISPPTANILWSGNFSLVRIVEGAGLEQTLEDVIGRIWEEFIGGNTPRAMNLQCVAVAKRFEEVAPKELEVYSFTTHAGLFSAGFGPGDASRHAFSIIVGVDASGERVTYLADISWAQFRDVDHLFPDLEERGFMRLYPNGNAWHNYKRYMAKSGLVDRSFEELSLEELLKDASHRLSLQLRPDLLKLTAEEYKAFVEKYRRLCRTNPEAARLMCLSPAEEAAARAERASILRSARAREQLAKSALKEFDDASKAAQNLRKVVQSTTNPVLLDLAKGRLAAAERYLNILEEDFFSASSPLIRSGRTTPQALDAKISALTNAIEEAKIEVASLEAEAKELAKIEKLCIKEIPACTASFTAEKALNEAHRAANELVDAYAAARDAGWLAQTKEAIAAKKAYAAALERYRGARDLWLNLSNKEARASAEAADALIAQQAEVAAKRAIITNTELAARRAAATADEKIAGLILKLTGKTPGVALGAFIEAAGSALDFYFMADYQIEASSAETDLDSLYEALMAAEGTMQRALGNIKNLFSQYIAALQKEVLSCNDGPSSAAYRDQIYNWIAIMQRQASMHNILYTTLRIKFENLPIIAYPKNLIGIRAVMKKYGADTLPGARILAGYMKNWKEGKNSFEFWEHNPQAAYKVIMQRDLAALMTFLTPDRLAEAQKKYSQCTPKEEKCGGKTGTNGGAGGEQCPNSECSGNDSDTNVYCRNADGTRTNLTGTSGTSATCVGGRYLSCYTLDEQGLPHARTVPASAIPPYPEFCSSSGGASGGGGQGGTSGGSGNGIAKPAEINNGAGVRPKAPTTGAKGPSGAKGAQGPAGPSGASSPSRVASNGGNISGTKAQPLTANPPGTPTGGGPSPSIPLLCDYGDASDPSYPSLRRSNGISAGRLGQNRDVWLGNPQTPPSYEPDAILTNADAPDENTLTFFGAQARVSVAFGANVSKGATVYLNVWSDLNDNGRWDAPAERLVLNQIVRATGQSSILVTLLGRNGRPLAFDQRYTTRITVTPVQIPASSNGSMPTPANKCTYSTGEVEDYLGGVGVGAGAGVNAGAGAVGGGAPAGGDAGAGGAPAGGAGAGAGAAAGGGAFGSSKP